MCVACHGEGGISQIENIPSLAGQPDLFTQWQLVFFRAGTRKNEQMQPIVEQLNNEDIRNLGAYFASLAPPKRKPTTIRISPEGCAGRRGRRCASCHTDNYAGTKAVARVAGQREDYLVKALRDYKSGVRSGGGMAAMARSPSPSARRKSTRWRIISRISDALTLPWRGRVDARERAAGWGDSLSLRTVRESRDLHPTPSRILLRAMRADPPPPGEGKNHPRCFS